MLKINLRGLYTFNQLSSTEIKDYSPLKPYWVEFGQN